MDITRRPHEQVSSNTTEANEASLLAQLSWGEGNWNVGREAEAVKQDGEDGTGKTIVLGAL